MNYLSTLKCTLKPRIIEQAFIFLLIIFISNANAKQNNQKISIYLHPSSFLFGWMGSDIDIYPTGDDIPTSHFYMIYLTVEIPLNLNNSLIIQPSLWYQEGMTGISGRTYYHQDMVKRLGPGIGFRHFIGDGLYLQAMSSIYYYSIEVEDGGWIKDNDGIDKYESTYKKGFYADLLGYLGYSWKGKIICTFSDIGIGFGYPSNSPTRELSAILFKKQKPLIHDVNFGIGISF
jgi:hypothetical protein